VKPVISHGTGFNSSVGIFKQQVPADTGDRLEKVTAVRIWNIMAL